MNKAKNIVNISLSLLQNTKKQFLILKRPEHVHCPSCWSFPGGKIKPPETALQAAQRELQEETSIHSEIWTHLGCFEYDYPQAYFYFHLFHTQLTSPQDVCSAEAFMWATSDELQQLNMPAANQQFLALLTKL